MNNPYQQHPQQYPEQTRAFGRNRDERWNQDDYSTRPPNRSAWGEQGGHQQSRYSPNFSGQGGYENPNRGYEKEWQRGANYEESNYRNDLQGRDVPWSENYENYSAQQDFRRDSSFPWSPYRGENQPWGQNQEGQNLRQGRMQTYSDSGQFGYRSQPTWSDNTYSPYEKQNYRNDYGSSNYGAADNYGRAFQAGQKQGAHAYGLNEETNHRGRGPKGYIRTDERIREEICECLSDDPRVDASEITVEVREGVVTLEGSIPDRGQKHRVEDIADNCKGVKDVQNSLQVKQQAALVAGHGSSATATDSAKSRDSSSGKNH